MSRAGGLGRTLRWTLAASLLMCRAAWAEPTCTPGDVDNLVSVDNGRYHLELGFLVPFVYRGSRSVELVPALRRVVSMVL